MKRTALRRRSRLSRTGAKARLRESLDSADRKLLRFRFDRCERCAAAGYVELHHIISRRVVAVRHERENHLALCRACHRWWHDSPKRARSWLESRWPGRLAALLALSERPRNAPKIALDPVPAGADTLGAPRGKEVANG